MKTEITLNGHVTRLNTLFGLHWAKRNRVKHDDMEWIAIECCNQGVTRAATKKRVSIVVTCGPKGRMPDPDAFLKVILDGLVRCGALVDDSSKWCEIGDLFVVRGTVRSTTITLEDVQ